MATPRICAALVLAALSELCWQASATVAADPKPRSISIRMNSPDQQHEDEIRQALTSPTKIEMVDVPLRDALAYLSDLHKIQILIDHKSLEDAGASADTTITFDVENISLESALELMLQPHELTWIVAHGVLQITSNDRASERLATRLYPVNDLVQKDAEGVADYKPLKAMIQVTIAPTAWDEVGGSSSIEPYAGLLVISTMEQVHREIEGLLQAMRTDAARDSAKPAAETDARHESSDEASPVQFVRWANDDEVGEDEVEAEPFGAEPEAAEPEADGRAVPEHQSAEALTPGQAPEIVKESEKRIREQLNEPTTIEFVDTELSTVLRFLEDAHKLQIVIDKKALDDIGIPTDTLLSQDLRDIPLYLGLEMMLDEVGATWMVRDGLLLITAEDATYSTQVYALGDLIARRANGEPDYDSIMELLTSTVAPHSWDESGSTGSIRSYAGTLVVYQSAPVHRKIERLLAELHVAVQPELMLPQMEKTAQETSSNENTAQAAGASAR